LSDIPPLKSVLEGVRIGTTSYIIPDDIVPNVKFLASFVDDVELVVFDSPDHGNLPGREEVDILVELKEAHELSYTVHLPIDASLTAVSRRERMRSIDSCLRVMERLQDLNPHSYIIHLDGDSTLKREKGSCESWMERAVESVSKLADFCGSSERLALENLDYPFDILLEVSRRTGASLCGDVGHVFLHGFSFPDFVDRYLVESRVVHVHGMVDGMDHRALSHTDQDVIGAVLEVLSSSGSGRVVTVEVFSLDDFRRSFELLKGVLRCER